MNRISIAGWRDHIRSGQKYLATASNAGSRRGVFNNDLIFQMAVMAIEGFIVGLSQYHHRMPDDHTLSGLAAALDAVCPMDRELIDRLRQIEQTDDICSLTPARRRPPSDAEVRQVLAVGHAVARFTAQHVSEETRG